MFGTGKKMSHGDGHELKPLRWWDLLGRTIFYLPITGADGAKHVYAVNVDFFSENSSTELYKDKKHHATAKLPAKFPVEGGTIEVATSFFGLKRMHFVADNGQLKQLLPDPDSAEGYRLKMSRQHPVLSKVIGIVSFVILLIALLLGLPQLLEWLTSIPAIAGWFGVFVSPINLPNSINVFLTFAALAASIERALRLRYHWLLDGDFEADFDGI